MHKSTFLASSFAVAFALSLGGCGGGAAGNLQGTVSGLGTGLSVTLQDNGGDDFVLNANGSFNFDTSLAAGSTYEVTVAAQPVGQVCFVANGDGTIPSGDAGITPVEIVCSSSASIAGTVSGLAAGTSVTLSNAGMTLPIATNGSFAFPGLLPAGTTFDVSVAVQPAGQSCAVSDPTGVVTANVATDIDVTCQ